jgi:hypothetical protein
MGKTYRNTQEKQNLKNTEGLIIENKVDEEGNETYEIYSINKKNNWETIPETNVGLTSHEKRELKIQKQKENKEKKKTDFKKNMDCHVWNNKKTLNYEFINDMPINRKMWFTNSRTDPVLLESLK